MGNPNPTPFALDHFKAYRIDPQPVVCAGGDCTVGLHGQFEAPNVYINAVLDEMRFFCNPVKKTHDDRQFQIKQEDHHLSWYRFREEVVEPVRRVRVRNQFYQQPRNLRIGNAKALLVPAHKMINNHQAPEGLDHYKLYQVNLGPDPNDSVTLDDQFFNGETVNVISPILFGVPVSKRRTDINETTEIHNPDDHIVVFRVDRLRYEDPIGFPASDQFGSWNLEVRARRFLLVPTKKLNWEIVEG